LDVIDVGVLYFVTIGLLDDGAFDFKLALDVGVLEVVEADLVAEADLVVEADILVE
jgi:hypothetical protein